MQTALYIEINCIGIILISIILLSIRSKKTGRLLSIDQPLFVSVLLSVMCNLIFDILQCSVNGRTFPYGREWNTIYSFLFLAGNPFSSFLWLMYSDYILYHRFDRLKRRFKFYILPFAAGLSLLFLSLQNGFVFYIDSSNQYKRGPGMLLFMSVSYPYFIYSAILTLKAMRNEPVKKRDNTMIYLLLFPILPFIASIVQYFYYGLALIWISAALSLLMIFIKVQNNQMYSDPLTGLLTRGYLENYLPGQMKCIRNGRFLSLMLIDIDNFKSINDTYGHSCGDEALVSTADILQRCADKKVDCIVRMGGDEFLIVCMSDSRDKIYDLEASIEDSLHHFNSSAQNYYALSLSKGIAFYSEEYSTADEFIRQADLKMYEQKRKKRFIH